VTFFFHPISFQPVSFEREFLAEYNELSFEILYHQTKKLFEKQIQRPRPNGRDMTRKTRGLGRRPLSFFFDRIITATVSVDKVPMYPTYHEDLCKLSRLFKKLS